MDDRTRRKLMAILQVLHESGGPMGSERIGDALQLSGVDMRERTVRNYLAQLDDLGWTENLGRRGRQITDQGERELEGAYVVEKVGFVAARVDTMAYEMTFDPKTRKGKVILNITTFDPADHRAVVRELHRAYSANLGMGRLVAVGGPGEKIGDYRIPAGRFAIGTVCSVTINGILLRANIATQSRFGGLLQMEAGKPRRFTQIIRYDGSSLDPLEIFIRGHMTSVAEIARTGSGILGASFREVPAVSLPEVRRLGKVSEKCGLGGLIAAGSPSQPLLDIPVAQGRAGLVVCGGLNPVGAVFESGVEGHNSVMGTLCDYDSLIAFGSIGDALRARGI